MRLSVSSGFRLVIAQGRQSMVERDGDDRATDFAEFGGAAIGDVDRPERGEPKASRNDGPADAQLLGEEASLHVSLLCKFGRPAHSSGRPPIRRSGVAAGRLGA
jgi:hypothetical protein